MRPSLSWVDGMVSFQGIGTSAGDRVISELNRDQEILGLALR